uniref:Mos1 transposase HTH domain-containing protein n=1 Tax=Graphocephala atropunctata TaxID=36148 RepID=A0A1B6MJV2_9HEMI
MQSTVGISLCNSWYCSWRGDIGSWDIAQSPLLICCVLVYSVNKFKLSLPVLALKMALSEQRANIKFCVLLQKSPCETLELLNQAYRDEAMKKSQVYEWHKRFREGRINIEDDDRSGRPSTATTDDNIERVRQVVRENRRITIDEILSKVNLSHGSVHTILHDHLNMHRICLRMVPKMLTPEHKEQRMIMAGDLIDAADADPNFLQKIVTGDETWCFLYDPQTKRQSSEWKTKTSPRKEKFRLDKSKGKVMLEVFFDYKGLIHYEFIPEGQTRDGA